MPRLGPSLTPNAQPIQITEKDVQRLLLGLHPSKPQAQIRSLLDSLRKLLLQ